MGLTHDNSVAQVRENVIDAMCYDCGHAECERVTEKDRERASRDADALIAAVEQDVKARCIAALEDLPSYVVPTRSAQFEIEEAIRNA